MTRPGRWTRRLLESEARSAIAGRFDPRPARRCPCPLPRPAERSQAGAPGRSGTPRRQRPQHAPRRPRTGGGRAPGRARARSSIGASPRRSPTSRCRARRGRAASSTSSPRSAARWRTSSSGSATRSSTAARSRPRGTTSTGSISQDHPSRLPLQSLYSNGDVLLRTETRRPQIRVMETQPPPIYMVSSAASTVATRPTRPTRRSSTRSKALRSTAGSPWAT